LIKAITELEKNGALQETLHQMESPGQGMLHHKHRQEMKKHKALKFCVRKASAFNV